MDQPIDFKLVGGLTLHEILRTLEEGVTHNEETEVSVTIMPPLNYCDPVTDEDSGDEDTVNLNNLPGSQLLAEAELFHPSQGNGYAVGAPMNINIDDSDEEDNLPLSVVKNRIIGTLPKNVPVFKKSFTWSNQDLPRTDLEFPTVQCPQNSNTPGELFSFFWSDDVIDMFVTYSNLYAMMKN
ncbi:unnamed protein product, partial [Callosobruchus maculatus]